MRRRCTVLVNILIVLGLVHSGQVVISPLATETSEARVLTPVDAAKTVADSTLANRRANRKQDRRQDLRQDRRQDRANADRKQGDKQKDRKRADDAQEQGREGNWKELCAVPDSTQLPRVDLCIHGADPAPAGLDVEQPVELPSAETAMQETASLVCEGDGQSGYRVQVLYVYPDNKSSQFNASLVTKLRGVTAQADQIFQRSAEETGAVRNLRFVQEPGETCQPSVVEVKIPAGSITRFDTMIAHLKALGFNRTDRIYLSFTDATNYCGVGTLWADDRVDSGNWNYSGPSYSRIDAGCWTGMVAAHEVMHNLGGVQLSAPNSSGGFHCIDEYDVMCYSDAGSGLPNMRLDCVSQVLNSTRFDCGHNDYFHTNPAPGSYLATHWNPTNNRFLVGANAPPPPPPVFTPLSTGKEKKGKKGKSKHGKGKKHKKH
jgi:hypothetical protein